MSNKLYDLDTLQYTEPTKKANQSPTTNPGIVVPALVIQSHTDLERVGEINWMDELLEGKSVSLGRNYPDFHRPKSIIGTPLSDPYLSRNPLQLSLIATGEIELNCKKSSINVVADNSSITSSVIFTLEQLSKGVTIELSKRVTLLLKLLHKKEIANTNQFNMLGISPLLESVRVQLKHLSGIDDPVLIRGETGVGKELIAEAIYTDSPRSDKPFVKINLGAIPASLAATELFGTKKGAYTGAGKDRPGFFTTANQGTLFLDEIGEASLEIQSMLLRVLETGEFYPTGSSASKKVDVRIIAATDAHIEQMIEEKTFKQALFHRLANYEIYLPSLHERNEDIGLLFLHFVRQKIPDFDQLLLNNNIEPEMPFIPTELMHKLLNFTWPGNIRQLKNITNQLVIASEGHNQLVITEQISALLNSNRDTKEKPKPTAIKCRKRKPNTVTQEELLNTLADNAWEIKATADKLNISRTSIYELMKRYNLKTSNELSTTEIQKSYYRCEQNIDYMASELQISKHALARRLKTLGLKFN